MTRDEFLEFTFNCINATETLDELIERVTQIASDLNYTDLDFIVADLIRARKAFDTVQLSIASSFVTRFSICLHVTNDELRFYEKRDHNLFTFESKTHNTKCAKLSDNFTFKEITIFVK